MSKLKNSKYKNTGILFELLVRQIASDVLSNRDPHAASLVKKYFAKTELAKEHKLYQSLINVNSLSESKAESLVETVLRLSEKLNKTTLRKEKYNLIKEIKDNYNLEDFFKSKLPNYKAQAAVYTLLETYNSGKNVAHEQIIVNKLALMEHLTSSTVKSKETQDEVINEFANYDKDTRILTYKILMLASLCVSLSIKES